MSINCVAREREQGRLRRSIRTEPQNKNRTEHPRVDQLRLSMFSSLLKRSASCPPKATHKENNKALSKFSCQFGAEHQMDETVYQNSRGSHETCLASPPLQSLVYYQSGVEKVDLSNCLPLASLQTIAGRQRVTQNSGTSKLKIHLRLGRRLSG